MNHNTKLDHLRHLKEKGSFTLQCSKQIFSNEELAFLEKYGHWLEALCNGNLSPLSFRQKQIIAVSTNEVEPFTPEELAWFKYVKRCQIERDDNGSLHEVPPLPKENGFCSSEMVREVHRNRFKRI